MNSDSHKPLRLWHLLLAMAVFCLAFWLSYPYYRFYVDPDAVAYLTMAERAATGDTMRLVNALWSPLHPAMVAAVIKMGMNSLLAAQLTNALACLLLLWSTYRLQQRFRIGGITGIVCLHALALFLVYALYKQLFCDLWQVALLIEYLLLVTHESFQKKPMLWIVAALLMALAGYAKVYSLYFLLLHFPFALWLQAKKAGTRFPWKPLITSALVVLLAIAPWVFLMHKKYGEWTFSRSGALNTSWTLTGHKSLKPELKALIPPPYPDAPYTWEDPYLSEGILHSRFESLSTLKSQAGHSVLATLQGVIAANQISCLLLPLLAVSMLIVFFKKSQSLFSTPAQVLLAAMAIMPLGYLLLHFEARYIWLLLPLALVIGGTWLNFFRERINNPLAHRIAVFLFALSFLAYPAFDMKELFRKGEGTYNLAGTLAARGIRGSFTSNDNPSRAGLLAYWLGCNYYTPVSDVVPPEDLLADMKRYKVTFYFHHQNGIDAANAFMADEQGQPYKRVDGGQIKGLQVFLINP